MVGRCVLEIRDDDSSSSSPRMLDVGEKGTYLFGRNSDVCDVVMSDASCSRRHASLEHDDEGFFVTDLGSAQGTRLDGRALAPGRREPLYDRATLAFASATTTVVLRAPDHPRKLWSKRKKHHWAADAADALDGDRATKFRAMVGAKDQGVLGQGVIDGKAKQAKVFDDLGKAFHQATARKGKAGLG